MSETKITLPDILLLSESQALNALDKKIIREAGASQIETMTSGEEAARRLARDLPTAFQLIVVVNERLTDMSGEQFCDIIRLHPRLLALPILLVLPSDNDLDHLVTLGCGASALIARPYSVEAMQSTLLKLAQSPVSTELFAKARILKDTKEFDACLENFRIILRPSRHEPKDFFKVGMQCLEQKKWNSAIMAFHHALSSQIIKGEAELGMSAAYKGKGEYREAAHWLGRAAETFVAAGRWHLARTVYAKLVATNAHARNPFFMQARKQIGLGAYDEAAVTLSEGLSTVPHNVVSEKLAELCAQADSPRVMLSHLELALKKSHEEDTLIRSTLLKEFALKVKEREERTLRASEQRTEDLSRRLGDRIRAKGEEFAGDDVAEVRDDPGMAAESSGDEAERRKNTDQKKPVRPRVGIALRSEDNFLAGLSALPGDYNESHLKRKYTLPAFRRTGSSRFPRLHEIADIVRLTWRWARRPNSSHDA